MSEPIRLTRENNVVLLELTEPATRNALGESLRNALSAAVRDLSEDGGLRALILTGSPGVFCAGGDLKKMLADHKAGAVSSAEDFLPRMKRLHAWLRLLRDLPAPVIVAVDGPAFGAGLGLALTGDMILASTRATFCASFCKVGAVPDGNLFHSLPRMVGLQRARELFYTGRTVDADEALRIGLCMEVLQPEDLLPRARAIAKMMCDASPTAFALTKSIAARAMELDSDTLLQLEAQAQSVCLASAGHREAIERFARREPPRFDFR